MISLRKSDYQLPNSRLRIEDELKCGVYFLIKDGIAVYVGKSTNVINRVWAHKKRGVDFDEFTYVCVDGRELDRAEAAYTAALMPAMNYRKDGRLKNPEMGCRVEFISFSNDNVTVADAQSL